MALQIIDKILVNFDLFHGHNTDIWTKLPTLVQTRLYAISKAITFSGIRSYVTFMRWVDFRILLN